MKDMFITQTRARLRTLLAIDYALFIVYGSLSPFSGWRKQGLDFITVLGAPLQLTYTAFDATINLMSYVPLGLLITLALHARFGSSVSVILGFFLGVSLSAGMEYLQMYLPARNSSNMDILSNSAGTLLGAMIAVSMASWSWLYNSLTHWRSSLFHQGKEMDFGLALLALWIFGQVNPSLPMLGNVFISEVAHRPFAALPPSPFSWWESSAVMLNLLMLGTLMLTLLRTPRNTVIALPVILSVVALVKFVAAAVLLKSWALLLWINSEAVLGMMIGMSLLFVTLSLPRSAAISSGAAAALIYFAVVNFEFGNNTPSVSMSVYYWHYGHLLNYNGLAQTIYMVFPLLLIFHLWQVRKI